MASIETKIYKNGKVEGDVKFGFGCMIHPYARIIAEEGSSIIFGDYNIIEEGVIIKACSKMNSKTKNKEPCAINIGNYNHFKIGSYVENTNVQNYNVIDYKAKIINGFIESKTVMTPLTELREGKILKEGAVFLPQNMVVQHYAEPPFICAFCCKSVILHQLQACQEILLSAYRRLPECFCACSRLILSAASPVQQSSY